MSQAKSPSLQLYRPPPCSHRTTELPGKTAYLLPQSWVQANFLLEGLTSMMIDDRYSPSACHVGLHELSLSCGLTGDKPAGVCYLATFPRRPLVYSLSLSLSLSFSSNP